MPRLTRSPLFEIAIAVVLAAIVLIVSPGLAISGLIALIALVLCGLATLIVRRREGRFSDRRLRRTATRDRRGPAGGTRRSGRSMPPRPPRDWEL